MNHLEKNAENCVFARQGKFCLSSIRIFQSLPENAQMQLIENAIHTSHKKGSYVVYEGDPIEEILILRTGRVKITRIDADGEEHILDVLHDGQTIWHGMFLTEPTYNYSVVCLSDVHLCTIKRTDFLQMLGKYPDVAMHLIQVLSAELQDANEKALLLSIKEPLYRLAGFLLYRDVRCIGNTIHLRLDEIAASISLRPETVSRNISLLEKQGYIKRLGKGEIKVIDREGLTAFYQSKN